MGKIKVRDRLGEVQELVANSGDTIMEIIRDAGLDIEAACGGCCACATCHVYVTNDVIDKLISMDDDEESMLDQAFDVKKNSRLGCQIEYTDEMDGMEITLAPS